MKTWVLNFKGVKKISKTKIRINSLFKLKTKVSMFYEPLCIV